MIGRGKGNASPMKEIVVQVKRKGIERILLRPGQVRPFQEIVGPGNDGSRRTGVAKGDVHAAQLRMRDRKRIDRITCLTPEQRPTIGRVSHQGDVRELEIYLSARARQIPNWHDHVCAAPEQRLLLNCLIPHDSVLSSGCSFTDEFAIVSQTGPFDSVDTDRDSVGQGQCRVGEIEAAPAVIQRIIVVANVWDVGVTLRLRAQGRGDGEIVGQENRRIGRQLLQIGQKRGADVGRADIAIGVIGQIMTAIPDGAEHAPAAVGGIEGAVECLVPVGDRNQETIGQVKDGAVLSNPDPVGFVHGQLLGVDGGRDVGVDGSVVGLVHKDILNFQGGGIGVHRGNSH